MGRTNYNVSSMPGWVADHGSVRREPGGRQIDWTGVGEDYRVTPGQRVTAAATAQGATTLNVAALAAALPAGTVLDFGTDELAVTTAAAAAGATTVAVRALASALEGGEIATVVGSGTKKIESGTPMMEVTATGKLVPRGVGALPGGHTAAHEDYGLGRTEALSGYGLVTGAVVWEQMLPKRPGGLAVLDATVRTELKALDGGGFAFKQYADDRAS
jgi:hypothetical protein